MELKASFRAHLPLFDDPTHRHDRGWPHSQPAKQPKPRPNAAADRGHLPLPEPATGTNSEDEARNTDLLECLFARDVP